MLTQVQTCIFLTIFLKLDTSNGWLTIHILRKNISPSDYQFTDLEGLCFADVIAKIDSAIIQMSIDIFKG